MSTSTTKPKVLIAGLNTQSAIPDYFRELYGTPSEIYSKIALDTQLIKDAGYDATVYFLDPADVQGGLDWLEATLKAERFKGVLIGSGLRLIPDQTETFEKVVDVVVREGRGCVIMFNDGPGRNLAAIVRNEDRLK